MKLRKRLRNDWIIGVRRGEWWIGVRCDLGCDWTEIGLLGLTLIIPGATHWRSR